MKSRIIAALTILLLTSCGDQRKINGISEEPVKKIQSNLLIPEKTRFSIGDTVKVEALAANSENQIDSVQFFANNKHLATLTNPPFSYQITTESLMVGELRIRAATYFKEGVRDIDHVSVTLLSDIEPEMYTYRLRNAYNHDLKAFTQGLVYHNGYLYEGTGQQGESNIRKVNFSTGEVLQTKYIPNQYFGEGITIIDNKIYQLTWRSRKGFVYDLENFELLREFSYGTEGWGLTNMGDTLVMSDGSYNLYFLNANTLTEIGRISVFDQNGPVTDLNELEYIKGKIYANIYQTDEIAIIDPKTGKVEGIIDLSGLADINLKHPDMDVLNGIAYDSKNDRYFVTGKNWTHLFEIDIIEKETPIARGQ